MHVTHASDAVWPMTVMTAGQSSNTCTFSPLSRRLGCICKRSLTGLLPDHGRDGYLQALSSMRPVLCSPLPVCLPQASSEPSRKPGSCTHTSTPAAAAAAAASHQRTTLESTCHTNQACVVCTWRCWFDLPTTTAMRSSCLPYAISSPLRPLMADSVAYHG
jgi:hypothetical protein